MSQLLSEDDIQSATANLERLRAALNSALFGQEELIDAVVIALVARGHVLLEGLPGLGKTALVKAIGRAIRLEISRVQFTPDLLPGDITGNPLLEERDGRRYFTFRPGPLFANLVLADEINRAGPKTQAALLEAMQERQVTVMGDTHPLPSPFFVLATQNPIELEGTYPLPEAQLDRFLFKLIVSNNSVEVLERIVLERELGIEPEVAAVMSKDELLECINICRRIYLPKPVANFIARLVSATAVGPTAEQHIKHGAGPRAAIALAAAARARALLEGRINAGFEDVESMAFHVLNHRIMIDYRSKLGGTTQEDIIEELLRQIRPLARTVPPLLHEGA